MHQGKFKPKNVQKYQGNHEEIYYRSSWELAVMFWCDTNSRVTKWSSEEIVVPYLCPSDNKTHQYFIDFRITITSTSAGCERSIEEETYLVELKPHKYTEVPLQRSKNKRDRRKYIAEVITFVKNQAKWKAADSYARTHGSTFQVWTEDTLKQLGIKVLGK